MKTSLPYSKLLVAVFFSTTLFNAKLDAQNKPALEFAAGAGNTTASGLSVANQVITFQNNTNNPSGNTFVTYTPTITATFSISNQQYTLPSTDISTTKGLNFGGDKNDNGKGAQGEERFPKMNLISTPSNSNFTSTTEVSTGAGIDVATNKAVELFTSARALYNANASTSGRFYFGDLTITFNQPVTNPMLQIVGLGGFYSDLGFTAELELQTLGVTLSKKSGSSELSVTGGKKILNSASHPSSATGAGAATGSVLATGAGFTSLKFKIYMRGDGEESNWGSSNNHMGDVFLIGVSLSTNIMNIILPVELSSFSAMLIDKKSTLNWTTASELNLSHFVIEKSFDGKNFTDAGMVFAYGNSTEKRSYSFLDNPGTTAGVVYYRLRSVDIDGKFEYSDTCVIKISKQAEQTISIVTYPNPVSNELRVTIPGNWQGKKVTYEVLDNHGRIIIKTEPSNSNQTETINVAGLDPGFYLARVSYNGENAVQKIIKR
ncbi:MAG: T9SS type A sorting domain-containing protein [Chitinophagaceae bacterium]